jgi:DNA-binding NtrC family response regulator
MGQAAPLKPVALVVEDDEMQREMVAMLLEESDMRVIECESAEAALAVLDKVGGSLALMFTDVDLAGVMDGIALAHLAKRRHPHLHVIVTSGAVRHSTLPDGALFMPKPWRPLDLLREAERASG